MDEAVLFFSYQEVVTLTVFLLMALSWFTRDPGFIPGWDSLFGLKGYKSDATSAILFGFLLFIIPGRKPSWWWCRLKGNIGGLSTALQNAVDKPLMPVGLPHRDFRGDRFPKIYQVRYRTNEPNQF
ncbi:unnamed protein product [Ranitomeya imitator]|uniref:ATP synthase F0 subunit 8 n=1 Tax=Ranitomeya imitator TaxID=111125 RepID=A0ABN9MBD9_9NEOB|nr:unnamed protein product [Ranitomeya imitator]